MGVDVSMSYCDNGTEQSRLDMYAIINCTSSCCQFFDM